MNSSDLLMNPMDKSTSNGTGNGIRERSNKSERNGKIVLNAETEIPRTKFEFGGPLGALLLTICVPIAVIYIELACRKGTCTLLQIPSIPTRLSDYFDVKCLVVFYLFMVFQFVLFVLPTGKLNGGRPQISGKQFPYRSNAARGVFFYTVITYAVCYPLNFRDDIMNIIFDNSLAFHLSCLVFVFLFAIFLYFKSFTSPEDQLNPKGNTGNAIYDFFVGRELNPRIGNFDVKLYFRRVGLFATVCLPLVVTFLKNYKENQVTSSTLLAFSMFSMVFGFDGLFFEDMLLRTPGFTSEGFGFMDLYICMVAKPSLASVTARFIFDNKIFLSEPILIGLFFFNLLGYSIYRTSMSDKSLFSQDPENPEFLDKPIVGDDADGLQLYAGGLWGWVRHPNYLGELILVLSTGIMSGVDHVFPYMYFFFVLTFLVHRIFRKEAENRKKYGEHWKTYCSLVKYRLVKYVF